MGGSNNFANVWDAVTASSPVTGEMLPSSNPLKVTRLDRDVDLPMHGHKFKFKSTTMSPSTERLLGNAADVTADLLAGKQPDGFFVMNNAARARGLVPKTMLQRGAVFDIGLERDGDLIKATLTSRHTGVSTPRLLQEHQVQQLLGAFNIVKPRGVVTTSPGHLAGDPFHVQLGQMASEKAFLHVRRGLNDYQAFRALISKPFDSHNTYGEYLTGQMQQEGLKGLVSNRAFPLVSRTLSPIAAGGASNASARAIYSTFITSTEAAWKKHAKVYTARGKTTFRDDTHSGPKKQYEANSAEFWRDYTTAREHYFQKSWQRFMNPVIESVAAQSNWMFRPGNTSTPTKLLRGSVVHEGIGPLLGRNARAFGMGQGNSRRGTFNAEELAGDDQSYVMSRLHALDKADRNLGPQGIGRNRAGSFERMSQRIHLTLQNQTKDTVGKYAVEYTFQEPDMFGRGNGIWVHIIDRSTGNVISPGQKKGALQFFMPVEDTMGNFTTATGSKYIGRWTAISDTVMRQGRRGIVPGQRNSGEFRYLRDFELINQELYYRSKYYSKATPTQRAIAMAREIRGMHVFSATEMMHSSISQRLNRGIELFLGGKTAQATAHINRGLSDVIGAEGTVGISANRIPTQQGFLVRNSVNLPLEGLANPLNLAGTDPDRIDRGVLGEMVGTGQIPAHMRSLYTHAVEALRKRPEIDAHAPLDPGMVADRMIAMISDNRLYRSRYLNRQAMAAKEALGTALVGSNTAAASNFTPVFEDVFSNAMPFGNSYARPQQQYNNINDLREGGSQRANTTFLSTAGHEELFGPNAERYVMTGMLTGGIDEEGRPLNADQIMKAVGAYEQQGLYAPGINEEFGRGANIMNMKFMADMIKGTAVEASERTGVTWEDPTLQLVSGVPLAKQMGKHEQALTVLRGQMALLMSEAGDQVELAKTLLEKDFGALGIKFAVNKGMLTAKFGPGHSLVRPEIGPLNGMIKRKLQALDTIRQTVNAARGGENPITFFGETTFHVQGKAYKAQYARALLPTRIVNDPSYSYRGNPRSQLYNNLGTEELLSDLQQKMLNPGIHRGRIGALDIERMVGEGLYLKAQAVGAAFAASPGAQRNLYNYHQIATAIEGMAGLDVGKGEQTFETARKATLEEMSHRVMAPTSGLTAQEHAHFYGRGMTSIELPASVRQGNQTIDRLILPDELPEERSGMYAASKVQSSANRAIASALDYAADPTNARIGAQYEKDVRAYTNRLIDELSGKNGLITNISKRVEINGRGVMKAPLQQSLWATDKTIKPFSAVVSPQFAALAGVDESLFQTDKAGNDFFFATVHRDPNVVSGRMGAKIYVKDMPGLGVYVHDSLREALYGDSDGDKIRLLLDGMLDGSQMSKSTLKIMQEQAAYQWQYKAMEYTRRQRTLASLRRAGALPAEEAGRVFGDEGEFQKYLIGLDMTASPAAKIAAQRAVSDAQGAVGTLMDPLQNKFYQLMNTTQNQDEVRHWARLATAAGMIREDFLKVKTGNKGDDFSGLHFQRLFQGKGQREMEDLGGTEEAFSPLNSYTNSTADDLRAYMGTHFINGTAAKDPVKQSMYQELTDFVGNQIARGHKQKIPWFEEFTSSVRSELGPMTASAAPSIEEALDATHRMNLLLSGASSWTAAKEKVVGYFSHGYSLKKRRAAVVAATQDAQSLAMSPAITAAPPPEALTPVNTTTATADILEAQEATESMLAPTIEHLASGNGTIEREAAQGGFKFGKAIKNPWVQAGIAATGLVGLKGLVFPTGGGGYGQGNPQSFHAPPSVTTMGGKTRIVADDQDAFDVTVKGRDSQSRQDDDYGKAVGASGLSGFLHVNVRDDRKSMSDAMNDRLNNQLQGR
jgi:hypothetical protein